MKTNEIPVTECWRGSYEDMARKAGFDHFPTRACLKANLFKSIVFCQWVWFMFFETDGRVCTKERNECLECQSRGLSKWTAMYVLSHIVRDEDPELYMFLKEKCRQFQLGSTSYSPDDLPPRPPRHPRGPVAGVMPAPHPLVFTDAVARELKLNPWIGKYL